MMTYDDAINHITKKVSLGIMPGLSRISKLLKDMGNPQNNLKIIHIAGTNGKGTVANIIAQSLHNAGYNVGLFTSPWITNYREQIQIIGKYISKEDFTFYVDKYKENDCSEFEFLTGIMYKYFSDKKVDWAVVECGMGGLEDSTNAIDTPQLSVITSIAFDHTSFLGKSLPEIAHQKAGIIKSNGKVVLYPNPETEHIFIEKSKQTNSMLFKVSDRGDYYLNNIETAKMALKALNIDTDLSEVILPGRQEYIRNNIILDGAHNVDGAKALVKNLPKRDITAVIGMMRDKDVDGYLKIIAPLCKKIITTQPSNPRAISASELADKAKKYCDDVIVIDNPVNAVDIKEYDLLLICGSFFLLRDVRKLFL